MRKYFGTDGVRGRANDHLTLSMAVKIGEYLGWYYSQQKPAKIVIGKDTRLSSSMFEMGLAAGATATGATVYLLGVCSTPSVSYLIQDQQFDCGVMVSASHNPYYDNGIKLFNDEGRKMEAEVEEQIEAYLDGKMTISFAVDQAIGKVVSYTEGIDMYQSYLCRCVPIALKGMRIALDLANGSATSCAYELFTSLGASVDVIHDQPDGININTQCGSTHPKDLQKLMKSGKYDVGFAFDGDADRLIAVNEVGELVTGDHILYLCGCYMHDKQTLKKNTVVTTVMSNLGLYRAFDRKGISYEQTAVGDKYVFECMLKDDYSIGGEQSGHIIFKEHANTGDGILSALKLLEIMKNTGLSLSTLTQDLIIYPQLLQNVAVKDKKAALNDSSLLACMEEVRKELGEEGRLLVRASGTEPLVRVMVEAKTDQLCEKYVTHVVNFIKMQGL